MNKWFFFLKMTLLIATVCCGDEEADYRSALFYAHRWEQTKDPQDLKKTEALLQPLTMAASDDGKSLFLLGIIALKQDKKTEAENYLAQLLMKYPNAVCRSEALYWLARGRQDVCLYRQIWQNYPASVYADEAYFCSFDLEEYLIADHSAIVHLKEMAVHFPNSPLLLNASYLIALAYQQQGDVSEAVAAFQAVASYYEKIELPTEESKRIYQQAILAKIQLLMEQAPESVSRVKEELEVLQRTILPEIKCQGRFLLARLYLLTGKDASAEKIFLQLVHEPGKNELISRGWYELALLAKKRGESELVVAYLMKADDQAEDLTADRQLELWIQLSEAWLEMGAAEQAMQLLSRAVDCQHASPLQLKAMYLRGMVYRLQGNERLAKKQWEAVAKMEGEWADRACLLLTHLTQK